jgi:hypothetical protein
VVFARFAGDETGWIFAGLLTATGLSLLYGLGFSLRKRRNALPPESETSLKTKIEQLLTEARVIIPGGQALLGFQFVATLTKAFDNLPDEIKWLHAAALAAVGLSVLLLMTPAALHRLAFHGEDDPQFLEIGSRLIVAAAFPLALGISADVAVVAYKITERSALALILASATAVVFLTVWYVYPLVARERRKPRTSHNL